MSDGAAPALTVRGPGPEAGAKCAECPLAREGKPPHKPVLGEGPAAPKWIAIGEGPGSTEVKTGHPFVGESGRMLNKAMEQNRCSRSDVWITNVTLCIPPPNSPPEIRALAAQACRPRLDVELAMRPGLPVLALGATASRELVTSDLFKITDLAGTLHTAADGRQVIPTIHPAAILRGGSDTTKSGGHASDLAYWNLLYDLGKVHALGQGRDIRLDISHLRTETKDRGRAESLVLETCADARRLKAITIDLETDPDDPVNHSALQMIIAQINAIGLSTTETGVSLLWSLMTPKAMAHFRAILLDASISKTYHNMVYDMTVLRARGFLVRGEEHCTMLMHHAAFPGMAHKLQGVVSQFYGVGPWKSEHRNEAETPENHTIYCVKDTYGTAKVVAPLTAIIKRSRTEQIYELDREMAGYASEMHLTGIPIHRGINEDIGRRLDVITRAARERVLAKADEIHSKIIDKLAWEQAKTCRKKDIAAGAESITDRVKIRRAELEKELTPKHPPLLPKWKFNLDAANHVIAFLRAQGIPLMKVTDKGKTSTAEEVLEALSHIPEVDAILTYRGYEKINSTFIRPVFHQTFDKKGKRKSSGNKGNFWSPFIFPDGRIHPIWSVNKITSRWGSEAMGVQNWPEGDEDNKDPVQAVPNVRRQVIAPPGKVIVGFDAEQLEMRIMALLSGDPFLAAIFNGGLDVHVEFSRIWYPKFDTLEFQSSGWHKIRNATKRLEYGGLYGGADIVVWKSLVKDDPTIKIQDVSLAIRNIKAKLHHLIRWQQAQTIAVAKPPHELLSLLGRRRVFPLGNAPPTDTVNFRIQTSGTEIVNLGFSAFMKRVKNVKYYKHTPQPFLHAHDAIYALVDEDDADKAKADIIDCFAQVHEYEGTTITFPVKPKIGRSLAMASGAKRVYYPEEVL